MGANTRMTPSCTTFYFLYRRIVNLFSKNRIHVKRGNSVDVSGATLKNVRIRISGKNNTVKIGPHVTILNTEVTIKGENNNLTICSGCIMHAGSISMYQSNSSIFIDESTTIREATLNSSEGACIRFGKKCMLAFGIQVFAGDVHSVIDVNTRKILNKPKDIIIEDNVWLGSDVVVLKGVKIDTGSIVGIRSIVTKHIPKFSLAVGAPASVVKSNVSWIE